MTKAITYAFALSAIIFVVWVVSARVQGIKDYENSRMCGYGHQEFCQEAK